MTDFAISNFIDDFSLKRADGIVVFDAMIYFYDKENVLHSIFSEVQIVSIIKEPVVYIIDFFKETHNQSEMYSNAEFYFSYNKGGALEIRRSSSAQQFLVAIDPSKRNRP